MHFRAKRIPPFSQTFLSKNRLLNYTSTIFFRDINFHFSKKILLPKITVHKGNLKQHVNCQ